jgi:hypothetical protein
MREFINLFGGYIIGGILGNLWVWERCRTGRDNILNYFIPITVALILGGCWEYIFL